MYLLLVQCSGRTYGSGTGTKSIPRSDSEASLQALVSELQLHNRTPTPAPGERKKGRGRGRGLPRAALSAPSLQGRKVIARSNIDGFFYPGKRK